MRILLSDIPISSENKFGKLKRVGSSSPPINLLMLGTILRKQGHDVRITTDTSTSTRVEAVIRAFDPDIVGVTFMTLGFCYLKDFAAMVSRSAPRSLFIAGGYHATLFPEDTLNEAPNLRAVFIGEAERSLPAFVARAEARDLDESALLEVPGICFRDAAGAVRQTPNGPNVENLDELPFPDFDLIPGYFKDYYGSVNRHYLGSPQAFLLTSRGCPYNCRFCGRKILGSKVRSHSPEYILELLKHCRAAYNVKSVIYADEFFTLNKSVTQRLCEDFKRNGLDRIEWSCSGRVNNMDEAFARTLREAGCRQIAYGSESGSQAILDILNKRVTVRQNAAAVVAAHRAGLQVYGSFIIGSPGETKETLQETRDFILSTPFAFIGLLFFTPLPGSYFYEEQRYLEYGTVINNDLSVYNCFDGLPFVAHGLSEQLLREFRAKLFRDFYLRLPRILSEARFAFNANSWKYFFRILGATG